MRKGKAEWKALVYQEHRAILMRSKREKNKLGLVEKGNQVKTKCSTGRAAEVGE